MQLHNTFMTQVVQNQLIVCIGDIGLVRKPKGVPPNQNPTMYS